MATASVTVPGGAGTSGVIPCPLPATVEDAICAAQKMQPGGWENAVVSHGVQHLEPGTALEAAAYTLVSYDALGSRAINVPQTECRGINLKQLSQLVDFIRDHAHLWVETFSGSPNFEQPLEWQTFNLYHTSHWVVKPATRQYTCSYVELVAEDAETQFPCWFVSHAWQEAVCRFVACLRKHAELRNAVGLAYWVCAYANNQHKLQEEISANPRGTSFYKAMKLAVGVVLILDRDATPFTRIWCCFEESIAVEERNTGTPLLLDVAATDASNEAHVITDGLAAPEARLMPLLGFLTKALREAKFPTLLAQKGLSVDISKADASQAEDKIRILNCIRLPQAKTKELTDVAPLQDPNYSAVNKALAAHFAIASWFGAVTQGHDTSNLRRALAADSSRQMVELSFTSCLGFGDDSLQQLLNHLPRKLRLLRLDLAFSGVRSWNFQKEMPPLEQLTLRFTGSRLADASSLAQMLDTEQCLARSLKSLQLWLSDLPSLVRLGSWEPLAQLQLEELVLQLQRCGQVLPEAKESLYSCVKQLKRARRGLDLRLKIEGVAEPSWSWSWSGCQPQVQEVELAGSKAVDYVDLEDAIDDFGGRPPFPCSHSRCNEFHENLHGFCPQHRLLRHWWKLASWWRTAWQWAELSLLFAMQAAAEIQQRTTLAVILLSLYPVACLSLEESLGVPWAVICTLLSVIVLSSIVTTSIRFDTVRTQILQEAVATEASYSQVLQLPTQNVIGQPWLPSHAGNMLRVPTMGCGYADPRELRQESKDLAGLFLGAHQHLPLLRRAMNVALPDATLKLKLLTSLSDEEKQSPQQVLDALRFELMCENMQSVQEVFKGLEDRLASEEMVALGVRMAAVRDTFAEMSGASGQKCCQVVLQVENYYSSVILMDVTLTRLENQLSDLTKLADHFGLLDDVKSKWETSLRLCNDSPSGPLTMAATIFLQIVALVVSFFMAIQYFLRYAPRIRSRLSDFLLDALALDTEESNETFLEAAVLALPYLVLVVVFLLQLLCRKTSRKRPRPTEVLYEKYFGLRGAYYPFKVAIFQCFTVAVQALGKISLLGGLVTFAQEEQDATATLWLSVGYWAFFALLCWNSLYPGLLLMFPDTASARIGAAFMDAALDLGYILTYLGMVLVAMLRLRTASENAGNFGEDLTLQFSNRVSPVFAFPTDFLSYGAVYFNLAHACCIAHILQHINWSLPVRPRGERQKRRWLPRLFGCFLSIALLSMLVILLVTQDVFPMTHGQDFTCFPCRCSKNNISSANQQIDSCTLAAVLRQKQVNLAAKNITAVDPEAFSSLRHVQRLSLANNSLIHLPPGLFEGLSSLEQLDLTRVELETLHEDSFLGLEQLKLLAMSDNQLTELSAATLRHLPLLEKLLLGGKNNEHGRTIVKGNRIKELGAIFGQNKELQVIDLTDNWLQKIDPATFAGLKKLRWLSLSSNQLTRIPAGTFHGLGHLRQLDLSDNEFTEIPAGTFHGLGQLQTLDLEWNKLTTIPPGTFQGLEHLRKLYLKRNKLTEIPAGTFQGLGQLQKLWLGSNQLTEIPAGTFHGLGQLRKLYLGSNKLTTFPPGTFQGLGQLRKLSLGSTKLTEIPAGTFQGLGQLQKLWLVSNKLTEIPAGAFQGLGQLRRLYLFSNKLTTIPAGTFQGLDQLLYLDLRENKFTEIPAGAFQGLGQLRDLYLSGNRLSTIAAEAFQGLDQLQLLWLNDNPWNSSSVCINSSLFPLLNDLRGLSFC